MKKNFYLLGIALPLCLTSCIQDEALNVEAAIDGCTGENILLTNIDAENKIVQLYSPKQEYKMQQISFKLADNATITATPAHEKDMLSDKDSIYYFDKNNNPRRFTVTSEDKNFNTVYSVELINTEIPLSYGFEELVNANKSPYHIFTENQNLPEENQRRMLQWSSGNPGYKLTGMAKSPDDYPTKQVSNGVSGKCVKLTTLSTGSFGMMTDPKMPIAAGNIFIGSFDVANALGAPRQATKFGFTFYQKPKKFTGYYKFKAGDVFTNEKNEIVENTEDVCDIYAVLYETTNYNDFLDGDNSVISKDIVLMARLKDQAEIKESDEWIKFELDFKPKNGKTFNNTKMEEGKYKLAIVCSSSEEGAFFKGAVGSTLYVDELKIETY